MDFLPGESRPAIDAENAFLFFPCGGSLDGGTGRDILGDFLLAKGALQHAHISQNLGGEGNPPKSLIVTVAENIVMQKLWQTSMLYFEIRHNLSNIVTINVVQFFVIY